MNFLLRFNSPSPPHCTLGNFFWNCLTFLKIYFFCVSRPAMLSLATPSHCTLGNFFANCRNFFHIFSWWASFRWFFQSQCLSLYIADFFRELPEIFKIYFLCGTSCPAGCSRSHDRPWFLCCYAPRCRSGLCPRPCYVARLFAVFMAVERYAVFKVLHLSFYICTGGLELQKTTSIEKYIFDSAVAKKRKSAAQNRTRTTHCPNSVSYGAWKIFSPYGSCSACTIRNRFSVFSFSSEEFFYNSSRQHDCNCTFSKKQELCFSFRP